MHFRIKIKKSPGVGGSAPDPHSFSMVQNCTNSPLHWSLWKLCAW